MKKIGLIYGFNATKSAQAAKRILEALGENKVEAVNAEDISDEKFLSFENYILGVPTWFDGELPNYWDEFVPALEDMKLKGKKFAIYGLGDQKNYPENFVDGIGLMANILEKQGGKIVGFTSTEGYNFESSRALNGNNFKGLALDFENQAKLNKERISKWANQILQEFS